MFLWLKFNKRNQPGKEDNESKKSESFFAFLGFGDNKPDYEKMLREKDIQILQLQNEIARLSNKK
jgi:hypothetical protein